MLENAWDFRFLSSLSNINSSVLSLSRCDSSLPTIYLFAIYFKTSAKKVYSHFFISIFLPHETKKFARSLLFFCAFLSGTLFEVGN